MKFSDVFEDQTKYGTKIKTDEYKEKGKHAIVDQGKKLIAGYTDLEDGLYNNVPAIIFPIVWSILYLLMSISCYIITESNDKNKDKAVIWYGINLVVNSLWSLIFFGFGTYLLSFMWIILLLIIVIIMMAKFYNINKKAAYLNIPYILWIIFAGYLNFGIYLLNR